VKLTLPLLEPGAATIKVDGRAVGHAFTVWDERDHWAGSWMAYLWPEAGRLDLHGPVVCGFRLRDLRAVLEKRLAEDGAWWS
jgi:hypothetical protein